MPATVILPEDIMRRIKALRRYDEEALDEIMHWYPTEGRAVALECLEYYEHYDRDYYAMPAWAFE